MNPLPNRPLINNASLPLTLPNVPSFEQMAYNGRPRKVMQEAGKDFPLLNGTMISGPSSAPAAPGNQIPQLERNNPLGGGGLTQSQQHQQQHQHQQTQQGQGHSQMHNPQMESDKDGEEPRPRTMIFRPDDNQEWKERLRLSHEAEQSRQAGAASWDRREDEDVKDEEGEVDDDDTSVVDGGEGTKVWKAKRTLRKWVTFASLFCWSRLTSFAVTWTPCARLRSTQPSYVSRRAGTTAQSKFGGWT